MGSKFIYKKMLIRVNFKIKLNNNSSIYRNCKMIFLTFTNLLEILITTLMLFKIKIKILNLRHLIKKIKALLKIIILMN
jgi:hypothetical protein